MLLFGNCAAEVVCTLYVIYFCAWTLLLNVGCGLDYSGRVCAAINKS